jgi:hypothetical protein
MAGIVAQGLVPEFKLQSCKKKKKKERNNIDKDSAWSLCLGIMKA